MTTVDPPSPRGARIIVSPVPEAIATGPLLLTGGELPDAAALAGRLLERGGGEVTVLPTAAAYERPERVLAAAEAAFGALGGRVRPVMVLTRRDAENPELAAAIRSARAIWLAGGSPLHLRSVLKNSLVLHGLEAAWHSGAAVAGAGEAATALSDPMVDPRGGAFTVGLGLVRALAVVPHFNGELTAQLRRTMAIAPPGCALAALGERAALVREVDGSWRREGDGALELFVAGQPVGLEALAGKPIG